MPHKKGTASKNHIIYPLFVLLLLLIGVTVTVSSSQKNQNLHSNAATTNCTVSSSKLITKSQEKQLLDEINQYRSQKGIVKLTMDPTLKQAAAWLSTDMQTRNIFDHTDSLGRTPDIRLADCGYETFEGFGENVAKGSTSADSIFTLWKNDPAHNQVLLDQRFDIVGIDMEATGANGFWTMDIGHSSSSSTAPAPSDITPTLFCLGSCPTTPIPITDVSSNPSTTPNVTTSPVTTTPGSATPTPNPCKNTNAKTLSNPKGHVHSNATVSDFIRIILQFFLSLINLLLQLIGGGTNAPSNPNPGITPCMSPTP